MVLHMAAQGGQLAPEERHVLGVAVLFHLLCMLVENCAQRTNL